jgi:hypothetical protein
MYPIRYGTASRQNQAALGLVIYCPVARKNTLESFLNSTWMATIRTIITSKNKRFL